jgi:choline kinase
MPGVNGGPAQVVILGAGRSLRGGVPSAIASIDEHGRVMDWLLDAFGALGSHEVCFVGGFKADEVVERYPQVRTVFNREWARTGPLESLGLVPVDATRELWVCYSDVVFRRDAVAAVRDCVAPVAVAVDSRWRARYDGRGPADLERAEQLQVEDGRMRGVGPGPGGDVDGGDPATVEFAGVLCLRPPVVEAAFAAIRSGRFSPRAGLPELLARLGADGHEVGAVDLQGAWAELDAKQDLARFVLGTKAESLERLRTMDHGGEIGELVAFTLAEWRSARAAMVERVLARIAGERLIVRSSARDEDGWAHSGAGRYESVLDVARDPAAVATAVDQVFASYSDDDGEHQVLVQEMLRDVVSSGVVMTRTHTTNAPYYVVNFDDSTARTDTVTGGGDARAIYLHRGSSLRADGPAHLGAVLTTVQNIEKLVGHDSLDIEFAVTAGERVHVLQVRPIAVTGTRAPIDDDQVSRALGQARQLLADRAAAAPPILGDRTRYSVMTDWNPAEIIGTKPRRLATSLYRSLITDEVWAQQRAEYGYRDVRPCPLLVEIVGHPYVDVRATFNSFVPAELPEPLARRLVEHALARLEAEPWLHDKVEFDVLFTCITFDFDERSQELRAAGFSDAEVEALRAALVDVTRRGIARVGADLAVLRTVEDAVARTRASDLPPLERAFRQLDAARRWGTLAFAHLARAGFVATSLLRSLQRVGALTQEDVDGFLASVETVLGRLQGDARAVADGDQEFASLVERYGHLRPGTYDITSPCYRQEPELYLRPLVDAAPAPVVAPADPWGPATRARVAAALAGLGLDLPVAELEQFLRAAIAGREEGKFVFTQALSAALEDLAEFGETHGLTRDDLAHVSVHDLLACRDALGDPGRFLERRALEGREAYQVAQGVCLPGQIADARDLVCFEQQSAEPNFVTQHAVEAAVAPLDRGVETEIEGRVVLIPNADPGYDWLLARPIAGLVTMYGGANSHMAVRAAELGLPAAIGVGEITYGRLERAAVVRLDCGSRTIAVVR